MAAGQSDNFLDIKVKDLYDSVQSKFFGKENLKHEEEMVLWYLILNSAASSVDRRDGENVLARYISTKELFTGYSDVEDSLKYSKACTGLYF